MKQRKQNKKKGIVKQTEELLLFVILFILFIVFVNVSANIIVYLLEMFLWTTLI